jgi:hypothetical protein
MNLKETVRSKGFDLIDSPIRNHKPLQLWVKKPLNPVELYYEHITHALDSDQPLTVIEDQALSVDHSNKQSYKFNIGITILENLLASLGLGNLGLNVKISGGRKVTLSYDNSKSLSVPTGELDQFLFESDFKHPNPAFLHNANHDRILVITGALVAKNLKATFESNVDFNADLDVELTEIASGKAEFEFENEKKLVMKSEGNSFFPVAVKANRVDWDKGEFKGTNLVTDNRFFF